MKTTIIVLLAVLLVPLISVADSNYKASESLYPQIDATKEIVYVVTKNSTLRIHPCGKVDKLVWKEINENEDGLASSAITTTVGPGDLLDLDPGVVDLVSQGSGTTRAILGTISSPD